MSPLRKVIARNLVAAQQSAALLTTFNEVDMSAVIELRKRFKNLFLPDAIWEANHYGQIEGNDAIADFYAKVGPKVSFVLQYQIGHTVEVAPSGTEATGQCYVWEPSSMAGRAIFSAGTYEERYRKVSGQWLFERVSVYIHFMTPYEDGWVKKPWMTRADFQ